MTDKSSPLPNDARRQERSGNPKASDPKGRLFRASRERALELPDLVVLSFPSCRRGAGLGRSGSALRGCG